MKLQEFESKRQEYAEISDIRYTIEKLTRVINDFRNRNPNADYDASYLEKLFMELSHFEEFNVSDFKNGVCSMAEVVLNCQQKKYEEMVTNFENKHNCNYTETMSLRVFTAFSGYDSQCIALDRAGIDYELVGWSEIDKYAIDAHNAVYPQYAERNYGDISKIYWQEVPDFDLFTYSSPCQDFYTAGLQRGGTKGSGTRSSLLWECERAIAAKRPKYLLFENVAALVSQKFIRLFNEWQLLLERMGYTNFTQVLNAKDYGVPQNRERVFMVSIRDCEQPYYFPNPVPLTKCIKDVLEDNVPEKYDLSRRMMKWLEEHNWQCLCKETKGYMFKPKTGNDIANALRANGAFSPTDNAIRDSNRIRKLTPKECFRLMGVADTDSDKMMAVLSKSRCYQVAGNSIVVDVLAAIFDQLFNGNKNINQQTELF